jgi:hypothetical protein
MREEDQAAGTESPKGTLESVWKLTGG